jgi:hypothetical protein
MQHVLDLTGKGFQKFQFFPDAGAAFAIPPTLEGTLSLLVWGVVVPQPQLDADLYRLLSPQVQSGLPTALYLSGWGVLTFQGVQGGEVQVWPYEPTLDFHHLQFPPSNPGTVVAGLSRKWPTPGQSGGLEYVLSTVLEQPLGFMMLRIVAAGPVTLRVNPADFVTEEQLEQCPGRYRFDLTRERQLAHAFPGDERLTAPCLDTKEGPR